MGVWWVRFPSTSASLFGWTFIPYPLQDDPTCGERPHEPTATTFSLNDLAGKPHSYPGTRPSLICFVKEDCDTCNTAAPVLEALHKAYGSEVDVLLIAQSGDANAVFAERHALTMPVLDDRTCKSAFEWDIESVPSVFWIDEDGKVTSQFEGFIRADWERSSADMSAQSQACRADRLGKPTRLAPRMWLKTSGPDSV